MIASRNICRSAKNYDAPITPGVLYRGKVTTIYRDPYSRRQPEGVASLVRCISRCVESGLQTWEVSFVHTGENAVRKIRIGMG